MDGADGWGRHAHAPTPAQVLNRRAGQVFFTSQSPPAGGRRYEISRVASRTRHVNHLPLQRVDEVAEEAPVKRRLFRLAPVVA